MKNTNHQQTVAKSLLLTLTLLLTLLFQQLNAQSLNISTGIGGTTQDPNWKVKLQSATAFTQAAIGTLALGPWQPHPVTGTGAKWISVSGNYWAQGMSNYVFERKFTVAANKNMNYQIAVAVDDQLISTELVSPTNAVTNLNIAASNFKLSRVSDGIITCATPGEWTLRCVVRCLDAQSGPMALLVSGGISFREATCEPIEQINPCCPPFTKSDLKNFYKYKGTGGINDPYVLVFDPPMQWQLKMQAYINYLNSINSAITTLAIEFRLHDQGNPPITTYWGPQVGGIGYIQFTANGNNSVSSLANATPINFFGNGVQSTGRWYAFQFGMYLNNNLEFFAKECAERAFVMIIETRNFKTMQNDGTTTTPQITYGEMQLKPNPVGPTPNKGTGTPKVQNF